MNGAVDVKLEPVVSNMLPEPVSRRGITEAQWRTLCRSLYPGAHPDSVLMVWDYCLARQLDPLKKPCHIVPMRVKGASGQYEWRDVVMPGIYEYRTTAQRTEEYLGHTKPIYGPLQDFAGVQAPEWCEITIYRWNQRAQQRCEFTVCAYFKEVVALKDGKPNDRWSKAPIQMLTKCTEAAGLREAFPDEFGGEMTAEEMDGREAVNVTPQAQPQRQLPAKPETFDDWLIDMHAVAEEGWAKFSEAWAAAPEAQRTYLSATDPDAIERLKAKASQAVPS